MSKKCEVVRDLLPLYADGICSQDTKELIEEHVAQCEACRAQLECLRHPELQAQKQKEAEEAALAQKAFKREKRRIRRRSIRTALTAVAVIVLIMLLFNEITLGDRFSIHFSFSGIARQLQGHNIVRLLKKGDVDGIVDKYLDARVLYEQHQAILAKLDEIETTTEKDDTYLVTIDGEECYISETVYKDEYQTYLEDGNVYDFWMAMIEKDQPTIPQEAFEYIASAQEYRTRVYDKFHHEREYQQYGDDYLMHIYGLGPKADHGYGIPYDREYREGYYYHRDYFGTYSTMTENWVDAVTFLWQDTEQQDEAEDNTFRGEIRATSQAAVDMGEQAFGEHCVQTLQQVFDTFRAQEIEITKYKVSLNGLETICLEMQLKDNSGDETYAELNSKENLYHLSIDIEDGTIQDVYGSAISGRLMGDFVEEHGLEFAETRGTLANPYRHAYIISETVY